MSAQRKLTQENVFSKQAVIDLANDNSGQTYISIHESVFDVTDFLKEHPGGEKVLIDYQIKNGRFKDATEIFEDVGHSMDARALMKKYQIGVLESKKEKAKPTKEIKDAKKSNGNSKLVQGAIVLGVVLIAFMVMKGKKLI